jgi:hypothetical protein
MSNVAQPKLALRVLGRGRHARAIAPARVRVPAARTESDAAPWTLAAVVAGALLLAVAMALATALGG